MPMNKPLWRVLTPAEWHQIWHHVTTCDFPEAADIWCELGREAGLHRGIPSRNATFKLTHYRGLTSLAGGKGNLQIILLARSELLHLAVEAFCEVLIVTPFDLKDPIANVLPRALASWREMYEGRLAVRIVQAQSRSEFIDVLKSFEGAVMIFDGHGHHDRTTGLGTLRVGKEDISIWDMRSEVRVPPIVMLSACDTHAADRSHATTANGFLNAGAITVVASLLPVEAHHAALFIARLIWRLAEFLPAITSDKGRAVLWSEVMSGMLRLQLVYDLVMPLSTEGKISAEDYKEINMRAILATTNRDPNWWDDAQPRRRADRRGRESAWRASNEGHRDVRRDSLYSAREPGKDRHQVSSTFESHGV